MIEKLKRIMFICLCTGFLGFIVTSVLIVCFPGKLSLIMFFIMAIFIMALVSPLFLLIPYKKAIKKENDKIILEYGTHESKKKTYLIYYNYTYIDEKGKPKVTHRLDFSALGVQGNKSKLFDWLEVMNISVENQNIKVKVGSKDYVRTYLFPYQQHFYLLIKTFYGDIENTY